MMPLAPIVIFAYKRPDHLKQTVHALQKNELAKESELFIFCDGAKKPEDQIKIEEVRKYAHLVTGFKTVTVIEQKSNKGLANSIIDGVTEIVSKYGKIIVLEDDLVTSPYFLKFMNEALNLYENQNQVISIHGYIYPIEGTLPETFFLKGADCWGWATWKRGWDLFEADGQKLLIDLKNTKNIRRFNFNDGYNYLKMLKDQIAKKNDSWAIRWYASAFVNNKYTLYPGRSLIHNVGNDDSGTHGINSTSYDSVVWDKPLPLNEIIIEDHLDAVKKIEYYFKNSKPKLFFSLLNYFYRKMKKA